MGDLRAVEANESEKEKEKEKEKTGEEDESGTESKGVELNGLMRWEKFLPKMILRVLLVEADDSTRQIIAALLRKCSYKVAAVADGLKAWEILKGRSHNIDLILTEVDLPSISGYALLTLIMEHEICKSIPVIMMSSQDSISTVYKCMLKGAADYLVKPIRKNELRNLWQHVWRKRSSIIDSNGLQDESVGQQKVEATAENNAASPLSGDAACIQKNKELIEKGSDAQSSCTKPDLEAESAPMENVEEFSHLRCGDSYPSDEKIQEVEASIHLGHTSIMHDIHAGGSTLGFCANGKTSTIHGTDGCPENRSASISVEAHDNHYVQISSSKEAIDLIGAFHANSKCSPKSSTINCVGMFDFSPLLDLSLRREHPSSFENEVSKDRQTLTHSNASAFKRYTSRQFQAPPADSSTPSMQRSIVSPTTPQSRESELASSFSQQPHSLPIPVRGIRFNDLCRTYGSVPPPMLGAQSDPPLMPSPRSAVHLESTVQANAYSLSNVKENGSEQLYEDRGQSGNNLGSHIVYVQDHKLEHVEDREHISPATDQSGSSSFCNGNLSRMNSIGYGSHCGSNSNVDQAVIVRTASEVKNCEDHSNIAYSHRSILREAALNKFRLKRKERCYEKKVRYESRKKLAEQRPRVKGQFVRQVHPEPQAADKDG
ncbi:hypothetical protein QN277_017151 [Acacia crassicarpa]|uniref:Two-component response regulator-like APRR5 n=1 Tax=Acacia crassicarpa TaxID=499986 RepID=A0AAE1JNM7_9FABA|nr:hypothetical protein QN277_017151 [Acacia crassicarpa]